MMGIITIPLAREMLKLFLMEEKTKEESK